MNESYFKQKVYLIGGEIPRWMFDLALFSLAFAAIGILFSGIVIIISSL